MNFFRKVLLGFVVLFISWSINAQESGLVVKLPQQLTLHKFNKPERVIPIGTTLKITTHSNLKGMPIEYVYKGIFLSNEGPSLTLQLIKPPAMVSPDPKKKFNTGFKRETLPKYDIFLEDIERLSVMHDRKAPLAVVCDAVGFLGILTFSGSTYVLARLSYERPDLVPKGAVPISILGIGLSYLLTRVGHVKKYRTKARKKGRSNFWIIK